ncbi:MAG: sigma-70 family RNA polymerase sigma factor [Gemmatimonadaceae bacterium]|nr:sigma-70 family RNA polymerase sigma factor [Gemmatimonadaceae bacterium]
MTDRSGDITRWLNAWRDGDPDAMERLMPMVGDALRHIAERHLQREVVGHTLSPTALVHEAWLRLVERSQAQYEDRVHFLAVASRVMRRVLVDHARRARAAKRVAPTAIDTSQLASPHDDWAVTLIALDTAMDRLAQIEPRLAQVVDCRFFGGLTEDETAVILEVSSRTVHRDWLRARAWLEIALRD